MKCGYCSSYDSKVVDSRQTDDGLRTRRRRECINCGMRFTTYEDIVSIPLTIIKKDSTRQPFSTDKMLNSLTRACAKSSISMETLENLTSEVQEHYANTMQKEVNSSDLGEFILSRLKDIDQVAYIRFASVYRDFKDIDSFLDELNELKNLNT